MSNTETLLPMYSAVLGQLAAIDEQLDAAAGGKQAGRRAIINQYVDNQKQEVDQIAEQLIGFIGNEDRETGEVFNQDQQVGIYFGVMRALKNKFEDNLTKYVDSQVVEQPEEEKISDEEYKQLQDQRSAAYLQAKYIRELLTMFGENAEDLPELKRRGGGRGKRKPRVLSGYTWSIDDDRVDPAKDSLRGVATILGFTTPELRKLMERADVNLKEPEESFTFFLSQEDSKDDQPHNISAQKRPDTGVDDDEEDEEDEDDEDETVGV